MKVGRPSEYTPELIAKATEYVESHYVAHVDDKVAFPSIAGLAMELGVHRDTIYEWSKEHEEFSDIVKRLMTLQELTLHDNGLLNRFNSTITKLMLSKHGYRESSDVTTDGKALPTPIMSLPTDQQ